MPDSQITTNPTKPKQRSTKLSTQVMVDSALKSLNNRNGSSFASVKKFIAINYSIDTEASSKRIKKYVKQSLENGKLINTTGNGVGGSFKISPKFKAVPKAKMRFKTLEKKKESDKPTEKEARLERLKYSQKLSKHAKKRALEENAKANEVEGVFEYV